MTNRGIPATELGDDDLERELGSLHRTRSHVVRSGTADALAEHTRRSAELEREYLTRHRPDLAESATPNAPEGSER